MKTPSNIFSLLIVLIIISFSSCQNCDDCQITPAPKQVSVVNGSGTDLIFGTTPIYNPDDIIIKNNLGESVEFFANKSNGSIDFTVSVNATNYFIKLNTTDTDTLLFSYGKDKHIDCCNEFDVTITTGLNGQLISNGDKIKIVK